MSSATRKRTSNTPSSPLSRPSSAKVQFHILSFEGPDPYARAGGIATRITGLANTLGAMGYMPHLWFIGDPHLPGHEVSDGVSLHRWCQWISAHFPNGVYEGEEGKVADYSASLSPFLMQNDLGAHLARGGRAVILAEEWQTAGAVLHLDELLRYAGYRDQVRILWNANNVFGFENIDWRRLDHASVITTVSRYMKHRMQGLGVDPVVLPNGLTPDAFDPIDTVAGKAFDQFRGERMVVAKMARFDPDKRWMQSIDILVELKRTGSNPVFVARGGMEAHGEEVLSYAYHRGLKVVDCKLRAGGPGALVEALKGMRTADVINLQSHVDSDARRLLFAKSDVVLANSSHEPFGMVGLEAMAAGGVACTGYSGEDYVVPGRNALVLQTSDPTEFIGMFDQLKNNPEEEARLRQSGKETAKDFAWEEVVTRNILPRLDLLRTAEDKEAAE